MITGTYNLEANPSWSLLQFQEVRLECDTTLGPVTINLPSIAKLSQSTNLKLIIVDATANASSNNITINSGSVGAPPVFDTFDDSTTTSLILDTDGSSVALQNVSSNQWIATESISGGGGSLPSNKGSLVNISNGTLISSPLSRTFGIGEPTINPSIDFTGSTSETLLTSILIPKNSFRIGDYVTNSVMSISFSFNQSVGGMILKAYYNTSNSLSGATVLDSETFGVTGISSSGFSAPFNPSAPKDIEFITNSQLQAIDFTACPVKYNNYGTFDITQDVYILFTVTLNQSADKISIAIMFNGGRFFQGV